jgi:hypothetical protein
MALGVAIRTTVIDLQFIYVILMFFHALQFGHGGTTLLIAYEVTDTVSWLVTGSGINRQAVASVSDATFCLERMSDALFLAVAVALLIVAFSFVPSFRASEPNRLSNSTVWLSGLVSCICLYPFAVHRLDVWAPFRSEGHEASLSLARIRRSFTTPISARARGPFLRNLVLVVVESLEYSYLGGFNADYPLSMPWMSTLARNFSFFSNVGPQPYTGWSSAGALVSQCGYPQLLTRVSMVDRVVHGTLKGFDQVPCVSDFLKTLGYRLLAYASTGLETMDLGPFLLRHGYRTFDRTNHFRHGDADLFQFLADDVLPALLRNGSAPFVLLIINADTHPPFTIGRGCRNDLPPHYPRVYRSFTCFDATLHRFFDSFRQTTLAKDTEFLVYGDHLTMDFARVAYPLARNLTIFFPLRARDSGWENGRSKSLSYFDLPPTMMKALHVEYNPPFPFGEDIFSVKAGTVPDSNDRKAIYRLISGDLTFESVRCQGAHHFCRGQEV